MGYIRFSPVCLGACPKTNRGNSTFLVANFSAFVVTNFSVVLFTDYTISVFVRFVSKNRFFACCFSSLFIYFGFIKL
jgi:hypothetical protein